MLVSHSVQEENILQSSAYMGRRRSIPNPSLLPQRLASNSCMYRCPNEDFVFSADSGVNMETVRISVFYCFRNIPPLLLNHVHLYCSATLNSWGLWLIIQFRLWVWLAEAEKELGLEISDEAISQMKAHITMTDEDFEVAAVEEKWVPAHDSSRFGTYFDNLI